MSKKNVLASRRQLRRHIQLALIGVALGAGLIAVPAYAATYEVTTTADSGVGSLRWAITQANANPGSTVNSSLVNPSFIINSPLPTLTNKTIVQLVGATLTDNLTSETRTFTNGGYVLSDNSTLTGSITATNGGGISVRTGSTIKGNATSNGSDGIGNESLVGIFSGSTIGALNAGVLQSGTGNITASNGGSIYVGGASSILGNAVSDGAVSNGSHSIITIKEDSEVGTVNNGILQDGTGNITATNGGRLTLRDSDAYGNATADGDNYGDQSEINIENSNIGNILDDGNNTLQVGTGNIIATNGGYIDVYDSDIYGNATADGTSNNGDRSEIYLEDAYVGNILHDGIYSLQEGTGNISATNGGHIDVYDSDIYGNVIADGVNANGDRSEVYIEDSDIGNILYNGIYSLQDGTGNITATNGGYIYVYDSDIYGNVIADGVNANGTRTEIRIYDSYIGHTLDDGNNTLQEGTGNLTVTNGGMVNVEDSHIHGNATASDNSRIDLDDTWIGNHENPGQAGTGVLTANGTSEINLDSYNRVYGDVFLNDSSILRNSGGNNVFNHESGVTSFAANATFAPDVYNAYYDGPLEVDALELNNSILRPWFSDSDSPLPVGDVNHNNIAVIHYQSVDGIFNPVALSPLDVGVANTSTSGSGNVVVFLNSNHVDFNKLPGGSDNAQSLGGFLGRFINSTQDQTNGAPLDLSLLPAPTIDNFFLSLMSKAALSETSYDGNLNFLNYIAQLSGFGAYSAHNMQAYWNQKSFIDSIQANLNNDRNMSGGQGASFALNQMPGATSAPSQLASLRQAMAPSLNRFSFDGNNGSRSSGVWASYNGNHQSTDADSGIGSNEWSSSTNGFTVGYTAGGDRFSWGVAAGHQKSDLNFSDIAANGTQEGWNLGLYGSFKSKSTYLTGILGYGKYDNDSYNAFTNTTSFENKATSVSLEIGKHLSEKKSGGFTPYASVLWSKIKQDDITISGLGSGLALQSDSNNVLTTEIGLRYNHRMFDKNDVLKGGWQAGAAWLHQGSDTGLPASFAAPSAPTAGSFQISGTPLAGNSLRVQLGAYGRIHNNLIGFAGYQGTFGSSQKINAVNAGIGYQF